MSLVGFKAQNHPQQARNARPDRKRRAPQGSQVRIPPEIHRRLRDEAEARGVSIQWLTVKLLTEAIDMLNPADEMRLTRDRSVP